MQEGARRPSLAYEQTLIVFDAEQGKQHFIREITFRGTPSTFGFVVPAPTRPTVAAVKTSPFADLRDSFPFERPEPRGRGLLRSIGAGGTGATSSSGVTVLEKRQVGSFTAFVLAASDRKALSKWLRDNGFTSTRQADAWLAKYVPLGFYYVAMRYRPSADGASSDAVHAETMRISFDTPVPYYPYQEPASKAPQDDAEPRLAELWLVSQRSFGLSPGASAAGRAVGCGLSERATRTRPPTAAPSLRRSPRRDPCCRKDGCRSNASWTRSCGAPASVTSSSSHPTSSRSRTRRRRRSDGCCRQPRTRRRSCRASSKPRRSRRSRRNPERPSIPTCAIASRRCVAATGTLGSLGTVQVDGIESHGDVDPGEVTGAFRRVRYLLRNCYVQVLRSNPTIEYWKAPRALRARRFGHRHRRRGTRSPGVGAVRAPRPRRGAVPGAEVGDGIGRSDRRVPAPIVAQLPCRQRWRKTPWPYVGPPASCRWPACSAADSPGNTGINLEAGTRAARTLTRSLVAHQPTRFFAIREPRSPDL